MKKVSLILSIILTTLVFSMSLVSGSDSGSMSFGITNIIYDIILKIFPNNQIDIDSMHLVIRKLAHMGEYGLLATSWFITAKYWNLSLISLLFMGLVIAGIDETFQLIAENRGPSIIDALVFDFIPYAGISVICYIFNHSKKGKTIMTTDTLMKLQNNSISAESAYKELFKEEKIRRVPLMKRAHFIKLRIVVPEEKGVNTFLGVLFFLPVPILLLRIILGFVKIDKFDSDIPISKREIINLISYRGVKVQVRTNSGEKVYIKTI